MCFVCMAVRRRVGWCVAGVLVLRCGDAAMLRCCDAAVYCCCGVLLYNVNKYSRAAGGTPYTHYTYLSSLRFNNRTTPGLAPDTDFQ